MFGRVLDLDARKPLNDVKLLIDVTFTSEHIGSGILGKWRVACDHALSFHIVRDAVHRMLKSSRKGWEADQRVVSSAKNHDCRRSEDERKECSVVAHATCFVTAYSTASSVVALIP